MKEKADKKAKKKEEKHKATELAEEARRNEMMPVLAGLMQPFETDRSDGNLDGVKALSASVLRDILKFYFRVKPKGMATMKKPDLVVEVTNQLIAAREDGPPVAV